MTTTTDWASLMTTLGRDFATRSAQHDQDDSFVAENYNALRERGAFAAGVPAQLGGGAGFYRSTGLERCFRDLQGVRYHPLTERGQTYMTGRVLLGLPFDA